jgi:diguanylate cyclase (GGDEF)-like protein
VSSPVGAPGHLHDVAGDAAPAVSHGSELAHRARTSALLISMTALLVVPVWSFFDVALEPAHARAFITLRLACDLPILAAVLALWLDRAGRPEVLAFGVLAVVQTEIAWMVSRANDNRQFYLLGFTLALYAGGLLLSGGTGWSVALVAVTFGAFGLFEVTAPQRMTSHELLAAVTYLGTAALIAVLSHVQRRRLTVREFTVRARLEQEQAHGRTLLERVERLSREDSLTGLANRRCWDEQLALACERAARTDAELAVVILDVDRFKEINDQLGHAGGDEALRWVGTVMEGRVPEHGLVARLGGDELAMLLPGMSADQAAALAERVRRDVQLRRIVRTSDVRLSVSQGVSAARGTDANPHALMQEADRGLYQAKRTRDTVSVTRGTTAARTAQTQRDITLAGLRPRAAPLPTVPPSLG